MRERRWESRARLDFDEVLALGRRLAALGLKPATPTKEIICYIEEWPVESAEDLARLDPWVTEDVTQVHSHEGWQGDFFLLAGGYHTIYQRYQEVGTYCSISHPWKILEPLSMHHARNMFWLGFRHAHTFIRVRLHTTEVITPGETRGDEQRELWVYERRNAFLAAIKVLNLPVEAHVEAGSLHLKPFRSDVPFFCSWPDAFGPCQFELNSSDVFEFLVPAGRLAASHGGEPFIVRAYLTGFDAPALEEFASIHPGALYTYRCSAHCPLDDVPDILQVISPGGRLYATLCEFRSQQFLPEGDDAYVIVGIMGLDGGFRIEVRLNRSPLPEDAVTGWLESLVGMPLTYAPLSPFP